jgi:hypothetical protein
MRTVIFSLFKTFRFSQLDDQFQIFRRFFLHPPLDQFTTLDLQFSFLIFSWDLLFLSSLQFPACKKGKLMLELAYC